MGAMLFVGSVMALFVLSAALMGHAEDLFN
jgi:hypothetical protein